MGEKSAFTVRSEIEGGSRSWYIAFSDVGADEDNYVVGPFSTYMGALKYLGRAREMESWGANVDEIAVRILQECREAPRVLTDDYGYDDSLEGALAFGFENVSLETTPVVAFDNLVGPSLFREGRRGFRSLSRGLKESLAGTYGLSKSPESAHDTFPFVEGEGGEGLRGYT